MRIGTGLFLGLALILGSAALYGCDDEDSGKPQGEKHAARAESTATTGPGWVSVGDQHVSAWHFARQVPQPIAGSHLASVGSTPAIAADTPEPAPADPLAGIRSAVGANMLPARDSVHATELVNRALEASDPPGGPPPTIQPAAVLVTTPWNDDTLLLWIAVPAPIINESTAISVEFDPETVAAFRPLGNPASLPPPGASARVAMLYELSPMADNAPSKPGVMMPAVRYGVVHVVGAAVSLSRIDRPITVTDTVGGIDNVPDAVQFAVAVAGFGGLLRGDPAFRDLSCADTIALAESATLPDPDGWRAQMVALMHRAEPLIDLPSRETVPPAPDDTPK